MQKPSAKTRSANFLLSHDNRGIRGATMKLQQAKSDYIGSIQCEEMLAKSTIITYKSNLGRYERWLKDQGYDNPEVSVALDTPVLRRYQYYLVGLNLRPRSVHGAFDPIQGLCKYLIKNEVLTLDPCGKLTLPQRDKAQRLRMTDEEVRNLLEAAERQVSPNDAAQSKAIIAMFCFTGIRADECAKLKVSDLRLDEKYVGASVMGKGHKPREVFLPDDAAVIVKEWLAERKKMGCTHEYLWASSPKRNVSDEWLRADIEKVKAIAGYKGRANIKPHSMRHWYATNLMRKGASIKQIQAALGHESAKTTLIYLGIDEEDKQKVAELAGLRPMVETPAKAAASGTWTSSNRKFSKRRRASGRLIADSPNSPRQMAAVR